jgi:hypothetical protein
MAIPKPDTLESLMQADFTDALLRETETEQLQPI